MLWQKMVSVIVKTILSAAWTLGCNSAAWPFPCETRHFQPLGIDLTVTDTFDVYMLEINGDPSFKYRNTVISQDDARMFKDLLEMLGFTEAGSFLGVPDISRRISQFCKLEEKCSRRLQRHALTLSLMLVCVVFFRSRCVNQGRVSFSVSDCDLGIGFVITGRTSAQRLIPPCFSDAKLSNGV